MTARIDTIETPDGPFTIIADERGVLATGWNTDAPAVLARIKPALRPAALEVGRTVASEAAEAYYAGDFAAINDVAVMLGGTPWQQNGWAVLRKIAPGHPLTYAEYAAKMGNPAAVRAAASVCARNPVALFVPCHRVLRGDGSLGGFAWGTDVKRGLLNREASATSF